MSHYYFQGKEQASPGSNLIPLPTMRESNPNYDILYNIPVLKNSVQITCFENITQML